MKYLLMEREGKINPWDYVEYEPEPSKCEKCSYFDGHIGDSNVGLEPYCCCEHPKYWTYSNLKTFPFKKGCKYFEERGK